MAEEWKWIKGYEGIYQVSNLGRIKSFHKDKINGFILSVKNSNGWYLTALLRDENKRDTKRIHQLVAEHFIGEIPKGYHVQGYKEIRYNKERLLKALEKLDRLKKKS